MDDRQIAAEKRENIVAEQRINTCHSVQIQSIDASLAIKESLDKQTEAFIKLHGKIDHLIEDIEVINSRTERLIRDIGRRLPDLSPETPATRSSKSDNSDRSGEL